MDYLLEVFSKSAGKASCDGQRNGLHCARLPLDLISKRCESALLLVECSLLLASIQELHDRKSDGDDHEDIRRNPVRPPRQNSLEMFPCHFDNHCTSEGDRNVQKDFISVGHKVPHGPPLRGQIRFGKPKCKRFLRNWLGGVKATL